METGHVTDAGNPLNVCKLQLLVRLVCYSSICIAGGGFAAVQSVRSAVYLCTQHISAFYGPKYNLEWMAVSTIVHRIIHSKSNPKPFL